MPKLSNHKGTQKKMHNKACIYLLISFLWLIIPQSLYAQTITVSGFVRDHSSGESINSAHVSDNYSGKGVISNPYGFFSLTLEATDSIELIITHIGYTPLVTKIDGKVSIRLELLLVPGILLETAKVEASREKSFEKRTEMSVVSIPMSNLVLLPALGGEPDLLKAIQLMPGARSGSEGSSELYVRGGSPDQNLILLDDAPLYYVNHLGGFVSSFNPDAVSSMTLTKGGIPARYGGRLSSILDIRMKEGDMSESQRKATIGFLNAKVSLEGPVKPDTSSYLLSYRRFLYDLITRPITKIVFDGTEFGYHFYDFNAKYNHKLGPNDRIFLSFYMGDDAFLIRMKDKDNEIDIESRNRVKWGNKLAVLRWNHIFSPKIFSNLVIAYTEYNHAVKQSFKEKAVDNQRHFFSSFSSGIRDLKSSFDMELFYKPNYKLRIGISSNLQTFTPGITLYELETENETIKSEFGNFKIAALDHAAYLENHFDIGKRFSANMGLRATLYSVDGSGFFSLEPRFIFNYMTSYNSSLRASWNRLQQNVHLLTSGGMGIPVDLWVPATPFAKPSIAEQWALGFAKNLKGKSVEISVELYHKKMDRLIGYKEGAGYSRSSLNWEDKIEVDGIGRAYGIEFLIQKTSGKNSGWLAYSLSRTTREFSNINSGRPFLFKYDRLHDVSIVWIRRISNRSDFSATWVYATGNAITLPEGRYYLEREHRSFPFDLHIYDGINTHRMRSFHKLDVGYNINWVKSNNRKRQLSFNLYNVYNRQNPYYYFLEEEKKHVINDDGTESVRSRTIIKQQSFFPLIPSVSYSFRF
ncbi:MAG: TonB-dependent receptor [Chitinophagaceae bacterium]|nr:MAG: TonB-dependent receptor [Chitinophagaceae bacterium]